MQANLHQTARRSGRCSCSSPSLLVGEPAHAEAGDARNPLIPSSPSQEIHARLNELSDHGCIAILSIEAHQSHLYCESEVLQVRRDGMARRGEFLTIVAIAAPWVGADPLARVHLQCRGARADHLTTL